ncbi:hypothetical protein BDR26DRAFT_851644 [Obelidium mucronatum]|nr:hypothetical protein BDR26DRAFT_851644 [Obelidium mucronatum]
MFLPILLNVDRPLENLRIYEYVWFSTYLGSVSTILLAFCPSLNFAKSATYLKMVQICITQIVLIDLFPFSWVEMQFYSPYIYGFIALANNIGVCFLVKKHRELVPKVMEVIGMKMEEESGNSGRLRRSATWEDVITAYVPVLIESDDSF